MKMSVLRAHLAFREASGLLLTAKEVCGDFLPCCCPRIKRLRAEQEPVTETKAGDPAFPLSQTNLELSSNVQNIMVIMAVLPFWSFDLFAPFQTYSAQEIEIPHMNQKSVTSS